MYYGTAIEKWQERICDHNKATQTRHVANRGDIIIHAKHSGYTGHPLVLTPTGVMEGKRFIGDSDQPFVLRPYETSAEYSIRIDPTARTYAWTKWMWPSVMHVYHTCLPVGLYWNEVEATRWVLGHIQLCGDYAGSPRTFSTNNQMHFHVPIGGPITVTGGVLAVEDDVSPSKVAEMRRIKAALLRIIAPYEVMRASCPVDHTLFGNQALQDVIKRPEDERIAEVLEMLNQDGLYMTGYQCLSSFAKWHYGWDVTHARPANIDEVMDNFMLQLKRRTYTTEVQS